MDEDDDKPPRHWGDYGALLLAGMFSLGGCYLAVSMALGVHPLAILFREQPPAPVASGPAPVSDEDARNVPFHAEKGEVVIMTNHPPPVFAGGFPPVKDMASLRITLERSRCYGTCPSYAVQIAGDGRVVFQGRDCVAQPGQHTARIATADVAALVAKFKDADYFALRDAYRGSVTDMPTHITRIAFDGRSKSVVDYAGAMAGMPKAVNALEDAIDKAAGTARWVGGGVPDCGGKTPRG